MIICKLWWSPTCGELTRTLKQWGKVLGETPDKTREILTYIRDEEIGEITGDLSADGKITIMSRRMFRDFAAQMDNRERQRRFREKGGGRSDRWIATRAVILERDEYMCAYCGRRADTVDHIKPKAKGGDENHNNLVACCKRCNMKKGDRTLQKAGMVFWKGFDISKVKKCNTDSNTEITPPSSSSTSSSTSKTKEDTSPGDVVDDLELDLANASDDPVFLKIPLADNTEFEIRESMIDRYRKLYPILDVRQCFREMEQYFRHDRPEKRSVMVRTFKGRITTWMKRSIERRQNLLATGVNTAVKKKPRKPGNYPRNVDCKFCGTEYIMHSDNEECPNPDCGERYYTRRIEDGEIKERYPGDAPAEKGVRKLVNDLAEKKGVERG